MTNRLPFTQASIRRAVAAARKAGLRVTAIRHDGTVLVEDGENAAGPLPEAALGAHPPESPSKWRDA